MKFISSHVITHVRMTRLKAQTNFAKNCIAYGQDFVYVDAGCSRQRLRDKGRLLYIDA